MLRMTTKQVSKTIGVIIIGSIILHILSEWIKSYLMAMG
jgi:hypothetical protein